MMPLRLDLLREATALATDTLLVNKMRSALTVLGVVIGVTAIVGMTSIIGGFDQSLRDSISQLGPNTIFVAKFSGVSFAAGHDFADLIKRPNLTVGDGRAIEQQASSLKLVDIWLGVGGPPTQERVSYGHDRTKLIQVWGTTEHFIAANYMGMESGRFFTGAEVQRRRPVVVLGQTPKQSLFPNVDPIGKIVRIGSERYSVIGVLDPRPSVGAFNLGQDDFVIIPQTAYQRQFGVRAIRWDNRYEHRSILIAAVPNDGVSTEQAMTDIQGIMRVRHGLRLDQPDDFDLVTQDAALRVWDQVSRATFLALVVMSSIALMVGGIGVMAIMMISVTERTREIGLRKALGARRREILWQFLAEAVFLTGLGGVLGILLGTSVGVAVHYLSGFPVSLPWWSFALGIGFSASVGIFFGMVPAVKASRLDPIEALRHE
jgi:putative ABC transport system permease protein